MRNYIDELTEIYNIKEIAAPNLIAVPSIMFQITENCCLNCSYCYQINKTNNKMSLETAKKFIDLLIENNENTKHYLNTKKSIGIILEFIGGEPLLEPKLIDDILTYFRTQTIIHNHPWQYNWYISISSNGIPYFNQEVQDLIKKYQNHLSLTITIDGNKELHDTCRKFPNGEGSYDKAIAAVRHYRDYWGGYMGSKVTLAPTNIKYTSDAIINLINEDYTEIHANCVFEKGWTNEHATIFYYELKKLADYVLDNNLDQKITISLFQEYSFQPLPEEDTANWCWGKGTPILTDKGYKPIETLQIGDLVYTADGTLHPIINTMSHFANNCVKIHNSGTYDLICTDNHKVFATPFDYIGNKYTKHWKPYGTYEIKDLTSSRDLIELFKLPEGKIHIDEKIAYLVGRYVGDGWDSDKHHCHHICCGHHEVEELTQHFIEAGIHFTNIKLETTMQFIIIQHPDNEELHKILRTCGHLAHGKRLPTNFLNWDKSSLTALLKGYTDADGYKNKDNYNKINTVSYYLAEDVMLLLRSLGYAPTCYLYKRAGKSVICGREVNVRDRYEIYYYDDITRTRYVKYMNNKLWTSHLTITPVEPQEVYNITVDTNHSYIAGGIVSSNCGGNARMLALDWRGIIYPCLRYMPSSLGPDIPPVICGNVDEGFYPTEEIKQSIEDLKSVNRINQSSEECIKCPIARGCSYCQSYNYQDSGDFHHRATYICCMHKARALANVYYWNRYYIKNLSGGRFKNYLPDEEALKIIDEKELQVLKDLENTPIEINKREDL